MKGKIFNAQEVQAIIAGTKTMFREVIKTCKKHPNNVCKKVRNGHYGLNLKQDGLFWRPYGGSELQPFPYCDGKLSASNSLDEFCPYQVGQKIFCKESFLQKLGSTQLPSGEHETFFTSSKVEYVADGAQERWDNPNVFYPNWWKKRPAQHMKQEHSRLTLEITGIKVERLKDISKEDAIKEGATSRPNCHGYANRYEGWCMNWNKVGETSKWASNRKTLSESDVCMGSAQYAFINFWIANHKKPEEKFEANPFVWVVDFKIIN